MNTLHECSMCDWGCILDSREWVKVCPVCGSPMRHRELPQPEEIPAEDEGCY